MESTRARDTLVAIGAPALVGACLGIPFGAAALAQTALALPAIFVGVGLLMTPALYIAAAFLGAAPSASEVAAAAGSTLKNAGVILLGLTPALAFLVATTNRPGTVLLLAHGVVGLTAVLALGMLFRRLFRRPDGAAACGKLRVSALFLAWSAVTLGLGWRMLLSTLGA